MEDGQHHDARDFDSEIDAEGETSSRDATNVPVDRREESGSFRRKYET